LVSASVPGVPRSLVVVTSTSQPSIQISWTAPNFNGGSTILSYNIYVNNVLAGNVTGTTLTYTESSSKITLGQAALFTVTAINVVGES
jgi:hypothetical protein